MKKIKGLLKSKSGVTMVSVIISFVLVLITFAMLTHSLNFAGRIINGAEDNRVAYEEFIEKCYTDDPSIDRDSFSVSIRLTNAKQSSDYITTGADIVKKADPNGRYVLYRFEN